MNFRDILVSGLGADAPAFELADGLLIVLVLGLLVGFELLFGLMIRKGAGRLWLRIKPERNDRQ